MKRIVLSLIFIFCLSVLYAQNSASEMSSLSQIKKDVMIKPAATAIALVESMMERKLPSWMLKVQALLIIFGLPLPRVLID
jgi:hypothetical protein